MSVQVKKKIPWLFGVVPLLLPPFLVGCGSISGGEGPSAKGIPYYLSEPVYAIEVKGERNKSATTPAYDLVVTYRADTSRQFYLDYDSGSLSKDTFSLDLTPDGRISGLGFSVADQSGKTVAGLVKLASKVATAGAFAGPAERDTVLAVLEAEVFLTTGERGDFLCVAYDDPTPRCQCDQQCQAEVQKNVARWIKDLEEKIRESWEQGRWMLERAEPTNCHQEPSSCCTIVPRLRTGFQALECSLALEDTILALSRVQTQIAQGSDPKARIQKTIRDEQKKALEAFAALIESGEPRSADCAATPKPKYCEFVEASEVFLNGLWLILDHSGSLEDQRLKARYQELLKALQEAKLETKDETLAYKTLREELDLVSTALAERLMELTKPKKKQQRDASIVGDTTTAVLHGVKDFRIPGEYETEVPPRCQRMADLILRYSTTIEAVVFLPDEAVPDTKPGCWHSEPQAAANGGATS
jgi:hypothetical protein